MQVAIPFWHYPTGGTLALTGSSHNVTDGYAFWDGIPPAPVIYTGSVTVAASGGTPPYTFAWSEIGGPSGISAHYPTAVMTNFWEQDAAGAYVKVGQFRCTVTDSALATATWDVDDVTIEQST